MTTQMEKLLQQQKKLEEQKNNNGGYDKEEAEKRKAEKKEKFVTFTIPKEKGSKITSKVRFIEPADGELMTYEYRRHEIKVGDKITFFVCPRVDGQKCPICDGEKGRKALINWYFNNDTTYYKIAKEHTSFVWLALVRTSNDKNVVGKVKYLVVTKDVNAKIWDVIKGNPEIGDDPIPIFDFEKGIDFKYECWYETISLQNGSTQQVFKSDIQKDNVKKLTADEIKAIKDANLINPKSFMEENKKEYNYEELNNTVQECYKNYTDLKNGMIPDVIPVADESLKTGNGLDNL